jgi:hypothetical protein
METLIFSLITLIVGALLGYSFDTFKTQKAFRLQKAEEVFVVMYSNTRALRKHVEQLYERKKKGELFDLSDRTDKEEEESDARHQQLMMLMNFYFPSLFKPLLELYDIELEWRRLMDGVEPNELLAGGLDDRIKELSSKYNAYEFAVSCAIIRIANEINREMPFGFHKLLPQPKL